MPPRGDIGWILPGIGAVLRRLGGFHWKWLWRYVGPVSVLAVALLYRVKWWRALLTTVMMVGVSTLGYEGSWANDWRLFLLFGQGFLAGLSLIPLRIYAIDKLLVTTTICTFAWPTLLVLGNTYPILPHGLVESAWGFIWYGCAAWLIVQVKEEA